MGLCVRASVGVGVGVAVAVAVGVGVGVDVGVGAHARAGVCVCVKPFAKVSAECSYMQTFLWAHGIHNLPCATKLRLWMGLPGLSSGRTCNAAFGRPNSPQSVLVAYWPFLLH